MAAGRNALSPGLCRVRSVQTLPSSPEAWLEPVLRLFVFSSFFDVRHKLDGFLLSELNAIECVKKMFLR
jgi:hypothetical protein